MFAVVYHFKVKDSMDAEFAKYWHEGTLLIKKERNSLGSRLHKTADGSFVAYAQWPTYESWKNPRQVSSQQLKDTFKKMNECLSGSSVVYELEMTDDILVKEIS